MHRASWEKIEPLFQRLLELPEPERRPWLTSRCDGDSNLFEEVWSTYRAAVSDDDFLESPLQLAAIGNRSRGADPVELNCDPFLNHPRSQFTRKTEKLVVFVYHQQAGSF